MEIVLNKPALFTCLLLIAGCATTDVQPLSRSSFKVDTTAAPACGPTGARDVAFETAAIQVIKAGKDRFVITGDQSGPGQTSVTYNAYTGFQSYTDNRQSMVVQMLEPGDQRYSDGLSARQILGDNWREIVAEGPRNTCQPRA